MNASPPRCAVTGSSCRLLQLELPDARPVWAVLDAAGARRFTGTVSLHFDPVVQVHFLEGEVYLAERDGDASLEDRLLADGLVTDDQLDRGVVHMQGTRHLGRLFDRVPSLDRDAVELSVEMHTLSLLGEYADRTAPGVSIASYRHHGTGIHRWLQRPASAADAPPMARRESPADPLPEVHQREGSHGHLAHQPVSTHRVEPPVRSTPVSVVEEVAALAQLVAEQAAALPPAVARQPSVASPTLPSTASPTLPSTAPATAPATQADRPGANLSSVIQQVAEEEHGMPARDEIPDDVRAAVRLALAEIEAATRPAITNGLSMASLFSAGEAPLDPITNRQPVISLDAR